MVKSSTGQIVVGMSGIGVPGSISPLVFTPGQSVPAGSNMAVSGILYDTTGAPLPNYTLYLLGGVTSPNIVWATMKTAADGSFDFLVKAPTTLGNYKVMVSQHTGATGVHTVDYGLAVTAAVSATTFIILPVDSVSGTPLPTAAVTYDGQTGNTTPDGIMFTPSPTPQPLLVTAAGYLNYYVPQFVAPALGTITKVQLVAGKSTPTAITVVVSPSTTLAPGTIYTVTGIVTDQNNVPMPGVTVDVVSSTGTIIATTVTNPLGVYGGQPHTAGTLKTTFTLTLLVQGTTVKTSVTITIT